MGDSGKQTMASKAVGLGATMVTAWLAQKILSQIWQKASGHDVPQPDDPGEARLGELALAAAVTGAVAAGAKILADRGARRVTRRISAGRLR